MPREVAHRDGRNYHRARTLTCDSAGVAARLFETAVSASNHDVQIILTAAVPVTKMRQNSLNRGCVMRSSSKADLGNTK